MISHLVEEENKTGKPERETPKKTISTSGGRVSEEVVPRRG